MSPSPAGAGAGAGKVIQRLLSKQACASEFVNHLQIILIDLEQVTIV